MMSTAIECHRVTVTHEAGHPPTLSNLSFTAAPGEKIALLGLNGTGKTTLLMALAGLIPFEGRITIGEAALNRDSAPAVRRRMGFLFNVPEDQVLFPKVRDDVAFGLMKSGIAEEEGSRRVDTVLERLDIGHLAEEAVHHLSHGQIQRVALAGALITDPPVLLLDEPTAGLDPPGKRRLGDILLGLASAVIIATHDLDFADRVASRFLLLEDGTVASDTRTTAEVRKRWESE